ncbi:malonyl CoA-acyl carrier protein transacylase [Caldimonas brevitalea]|uniref:Malonyl CoA-acyl carrier protein transacylase n=1 Tax=Caldimonas brevitalea TaxID=413882 RepID=A0A0G3BPG9_9BURK|nr:malonyl CoA-acyl carrier protein transacylase [Caldimonas brevitalea]
MAEWLHAAARRAPEQPALESPQGVLSYAELLASVTSLSSRLKQAGIGPGERVAIAATRAPETIVAILATVDAGVAYVPLDLAYPDDRLQSMLADAQPRVVLGEPGALAELQARVGALPGLDQPAAPAPLPHAAEPDLCYVLFTSGSTGKPKGVAMGALPLQHLIAWHAAHPRLGQPARTLQFAPLSFDVHFQEIFSTLACGGTLVLLPDAQRRDPQQLHRALITARVQRMFLPYVALQMLAEASREQVPPDLLDVISAGEQLQVTPAIRALFAQLPAAVLHNHYGPTESHVVTAHELEGPAESWPQIPPIGRALPHVRLALRNANSQRPTKAGRGELLLGGETLAHGYLGQADLSAERFRDDLPGLPGRWYVSGDLVERGPHGVWTYLGRADQQLKVDGFRIEPGEIELALMTHPAVRDAVVTAPELPGIGRQLVAHVVPREAGAASDATAFAGVLREHLRGSLPEYMLPVRYVCLERLPTTPSGKIDRRNLPLPTPDARLQAGTDDVPALMQALWQELLGLPHIDEHANLFELGAKSLLVLRFVTRLREAGVRNVSVADVYDRPTLAGLCAVVRGADASKPKRARRPASDSDGIAIVGMAVRAADAPDVDGFWQHLMEQREGIRRFADHELDASVPAELRSRPNFVAARGVLADADRFDAAFFGISAREATVLDPQQRLFLELCWSALEHAAIDPARGDLRVGVYAGVANNSYIGALRAEQPELVQQFGEFATMLASEKDYVATRVANRLNLNGPAVSVHTACSTGLVAVAQAWHALSAGLADVALAGGATVIVPQAGGYLHVEGGMESADGRCRPFDADASGTVFASAGGVVVLKRLEDALAEGDTVYAVIRGVGLNNDGGDKASFTAPSVNGQAGAVRMALDHAGLNARSIGYVEAHGTGTPLGDPIEIAALTRAWRSDTADTQYCGIGSLKSNLGHTVAASGVLGLIKAALALHHETIPATLHFQRPNPEIDFANSPFRVVAETTAWPRGAEPRRAAVSSYGVGGTNAHLVIEEAPLRPLPAATEDPADAGRLHLLPLSARSPQAVLQRARDLADHLQQQQPGLRLEDVAATLMRGRQPMPHRVAVVAADVSSAVSALRALNGSRQASGRPRLVYLFPGQGSQHPGMARRLYDEAPAFRVALDRCLAAATPTLAANLRAWLLDADPADAKASESLARTQHAQPALFCVSYALASWLDSLGLQPDAMIGHSVGEYAAACIAGVFTPEQAMAAVVARGKAMAAQPPGAMLAVRAGADKVSASLPPGVEIAGYNAPELTVVAGAFDAIDAYASQLEADAIGVTRLHVSHAFHSAAMAGALPRVADALRGLAPSAPTLRLYSCVTGEPLRAEQATDPEYWASQVRAPVQFSRAVAAEAAAGDNLVFVEVGPSQALTALLRQHRTPAGQVPHIVPLLGPARAPGDPAVAALSGVGALWCAGVEVAWPVAAHARRLALPTYPFAGERHWFARRAPVSAAGAPAVAAPAAPVTVPSSAAIAPTMSRLPRLAQELTRILSDVSGLSADELNAASSFVDQGLDSLSLTQATLELERVFGLKLRFRRLLEDLDTLDKLVEFLDAQLPAGQFAPEAPAAAPAPAATTALPGVGGPGPAALPVNTDAAGMSGLQWVIQQQMQLMAQQLSVLSGQALAAPQLAMPVPAAAAAQPAAAPASAEPAQPSIKALVEQPFGASARITLQPQLDFTPAQRHWLDEFTTRYNARTGQSKAYSQQHRKLMADPRVVTGFNPLWKDLVYPLVVNRSKGARLWDLDGNEYIDLLSCFGANLLGYQPEAVVQAMAEQLQQGIEVGPQHPLAGEVAQLISDFTGMERVAFCNTGSEAVMGAMRIARTVTGRKTIAIFTNSYHGIFDEVIVRGTKQLRSLSAAPGILASAVENVLVLDYASDESLRVLRERGHELAAIMIEPIQNKLPTLQPRGFVQSLREICDAKGCALIFDEVVTGFRVAPGGAQEFYGVRADLATYGKVIGGGLPFAAIAGSSRWLDALDGGDWQYGDTSYPEAGVTYFAGTFVRHPLALAAARAALLHLKRGGSGFYRQLNERTQHLVERLNTAFAVRGAPVKAVHCASIWRLQWDDNQKHVSLFYYLARHRGLHLYEQFGHFVTEAMGEAETDRIFEVFTEALDELMALGFILPREGTPPSPPSGGGGQPATGAPNDGPLSPGQTERWLAAGFDTNARRALNESFCVSLAGPVDLPALKAALQDVLTRHQAFRIRFDIDQPRQTLAPAAAVPVQEVDLRSEADADAALDAFCTEASGRDFPLGTAPLAACSLLFLSDGRVVVHLVASHLVFDGWASSVFNAELATAYRARSHGIAPVLPPAESPLLFARQELERMEGPAGQACLRYWQEVLRHPPARLELGDRTAPSPRRYAADTERWRIEGELYTRLRQQARRNGTTLFQLLLGAVTLMLQRQSGQDEFLVSIPYASQSQERRGPLMADGVLDLPLRLGVQAGDTPSRLVKRVREQLLDALEQPLMTQGTVARALGLRSAGDRPALTGVYFNLNPKVDLSAFAPLRAALHEGRKRGTLGELFFNFYELDDALSLDLHYSTEFFSPQRASALVAALLDACERVVADPDLPLQAEAAAPVAAAPQPKASVQAPQPVVVAAVPAAPTATASTPTAPAPAPGARQIDPRLLAWNATEAPLAERPRVEQWIAEQAARTPDEIAVVARGRQLSYRELDRRANRYAHLLQGEGIGPGDRVGLCLSRGPELLPALLGVLKAGAAYVPLDPGFPRERLHYMAEDAGLALVITESAHAELAGVPREQQLRIDEDVARIDAEPDHQLPLPTDLPADATAYVIYTSGSTGKPKGVVLPQRAVCNFLASMQREPGLAARDRLLAVTTLSFDIAVLELLLPLTVGARVVIAQRDDAMDGEVLARLIAEHGITVMQATPTTWHMLLDAGWTPPTGFRTLCGGEPLPPSLAARLLAQKVALWNLYGPTETTVWSTLSRITDPQQRITVGRPIDNTQVWILDEHMAPCAVGAEGEICIGGAGVASGYFKRPELSAERFVADPFNPHDPDARLYRTGDLGRWREDGTIEHLGRLDFQVKIRGYRIELGEIEARLAALPGVARSVVVAREDSPGDVRLVAYFVPQAGATPEPAALREALRAGLPDYMLPQYVVPLDTFPLLPNGKIDRKSLPAPSVPAPDTSRSVEPPRNDLERTIAAAMQAVLKLPAVGLHDDFFSLGGHSLLAARLVGQLNRELGLQLNLRVLFESPSVEKLSQAIEQQRGSQQAAPQRAPLVKRADQSRAPLTLMQERIRFIEEMRPGQVMYNAPSCHRLRGPMDLQAFDRAFGEMVRRHSALRTAIVRTPEGHVQQVHDDVAVSLLPLEDLTTLPAGERECQLLDRLEALTAHTFALDQAPLFTARLFRLADDHHVLFFMPHHIVWDGWSFDILYTEMSALYDAYRNGQTPTLPEPPFSYGDFAEWHGQWLRSDEMQQQLNYWKQQFDRLPPSHEPPADKPRQLAHTNRGETAWLQLNTAQAERVRELAKQTGSTLSIVALSVYAAMMSQWLGDPHPAIGMPVRGRPLPELESVMGFFNNMLPLRPTVQTGLSALDWIKATRHTVVEAFAHQDVPFELLAQQLESRQQGARGRLYQVMFSFQDARQRQDHWGPLAHERIKVMQKGATEDINLWLVEVPGGIEGGVQYNAELFLQSTAEWLRDRFLALLERFVEQPGRPVAELLADVSADTPTEPAGSPSPAVDTVAAVTTLQSWLSAQPDAPALRSAERSLRYAELQQLVSATVERLPQGDAAPRAIGICIADPVASAVAALAALSSGARCLVVDPHGTAPTLRATLAAGEVDCVISDESFRIHVPAPLAWLDAKTLPGHVPAATLPKLPRQDYTGAAETPRRAVSVEQYVGAAQQLGAVLTLSAGTTVLALEGAPRSHQLFDLCLALACGGDCLITADNPQAVPPSLLARTPTLLMAGGPTWCRWLDARPGTPLPTVALLDAAEASPRLVAELRQAGCTPWAFLRADDTGVPVSAGVLEADDPGHAGALLLSGLQIVDADGQPVPPGRGGRLKTAASGAAGQRQARWRSDGRLQVVADDECLQIDGWAVQRTGLAQALGGLPGVGSVEVSLVEPRPGDRRLRVQATPASGSTLDVAALTTTLKQGLPQRLGAAVEIQLAAAPAAAKAAGANGASASGGDTLTDAQRAVAEVWSELLRVSRIEPKDNFFDLGGTSLLAMQAVARLEQRFRRPVNARRYVFETLAQLATAYEGGTEPAAAVVAAPEGKAAPATTSPRPAKGVLGRLTGWLPRRTAPKAAEPDAADRSS